MQDNQFECGACFRTVTKFSPKPTSYSKPEESWVYETKSYPLPEGSVESGFFDLGLIHSDLVLPPGWVRLTAGFYLRHDGCVVFKSGDLWVSDIEDVKLGSWRIVEEYSSRWDKVVPLTGINPWDLMIQTNYRYPGAAFNLRKPWVFKAEGSLRTYIRPDGYAVSIFGGYGKYVTYKGNAIDIKPPDLSNGDMLMWVDKTYVYPWVPPSKLELMMTDEPPKGPKVEPPQTPNNPWNTTVWVMSRL